MQQPQCRSQCNTSGLPPQGGDRTSVLVADDLVTFGKVPDWATEVIEDAKAYKFWCWLHRKVNNSTRECWHKQSTLAEEYGVSVSTLSKWFVYLRSVGALTTMRRWSHGYRRLSDLIKLTWHDPRVVSPQWNDQGRSPACLYTGAKHKGTRPTTSSLRSEVDTGSRSSSTSASRSEKTSLRSVAQAQRFAYSSKRANKMARDETPAQGSLFGEEEISQVDEKCQSRQTSDRKVCRDSKGGTVHRLMAYWLAGRVERPARHVVLGMGRAFKQCTEHGVSEEEIRNQLDALMREGLDIFPRHLLLRCGLAKFGKQKKRDYEANPLFMHHQKRSSMTQERKEQIWQREENLRSQIRESRQSSIDSSPRCPSDKSHASDISNKSTEEVFQDITVVREALDTGIMQNSYTAGSLAKSILAGLRP